VQRRSRHPPPTVSFPEPLSPLRAVPRRKKLPIPYVLSCLFSGRRLVHLRLVLSPEWRSCTAQRTKTSTSRLKKTWIKTCNCPELGNLVHYPPFFFCEPPRYSTGPVHSQVLFFDLQTVAVLEHDADVRVIDSVSSSLQGC